MFDFSESPVTLLLLIANVLLSGYALFFDPSLVDRFSFRPRQILEGKQYYRLITAGFVHAGIGHLAFNMLTLYFFGPVLEHVLGPRGFLVLYFVSELAAHGLTLLLHKNSPSYAAVGASGAISGVVFAFCLYFPLEKIYLFLIPVGIPAVLFAVLYVAISIYAMRQSREAGMTGGIAHEAHVGGAIGGLLITILMDPGAIQIFLGQLRM